MNYFALFSLTEQYDIDLDLLNSKYFSMQQSHHPDLTLNEKEKNDKSNKSAKINEAYKTLKDDYLRAKYLLMINGENIDDSKNKLSLDWLENIFQQFENISHISLSDLEKKSRSTLDEKNNLIQKLSDSFRNNNLSQAVDLTIKLKYLTNISNNIKLRLKNAVNSN